MTQVYIERYWRDAKPEDAIKEPPMWARFIDEDDKNWEYDLLVGWDRTDDAPWRTKLTAFEHSQVYDAPDPGEGWRLIDIDKETKQDGDEYLHSDGWAKADKAPFSRIRPYRRRITLAVTYVPFTWEDREQLRGRWIGSNDGRCQRSINTMHNDNGSFYLCAINAESLCTDWHFLDTGEPVGKKVAQ